MLRFDDIHRTELLDQVCERARWRLPEAQADAVIGFIRRYYAHVPVEDIEGRSDDALFGAAFAHWRLAERRPARRALVHVFNPELDEHGWQAADTLVQIVTDDMPFLVDSVTAELIRRDLALHLIVHPVLRVHRADDGGLQGLPPTEAGGEDGRSGQAESFMHLEITRQPAAACDGIAASLQGVLADVRTCVEDWAAIRRRLAQVIAELASAAAAPDEIQESVTFLEWIRDNNFTFLGYRGFDFPAVDIPTGDAPTGDAPTGDTPAGSGVRFVRIDGDVGLGLLRDPASRVFEDLREGEPVPPAIRAFQERGELLSVAKSQHRSTVNRRVPMDIILVKRLDEAGRPVGAHLIAGLFSAATYNRSARNIPLLRRKLTRTLEEAGFEPRSHNGRALANIVETFPRDELFQVTDRQLLDVSLGLLELQQRQRVAVFVRRDDFDRFISCLVYVPRDRYTTQFRLLIQGILERAFAGTVSAHYLQVGDAPLARLHVIVDTIPGRIPPYDVKDLEAAIASAARTWSERLMEALEAAHGAEEARRLHRRYQEAFPLGYRERFNAEQAIGDVAEIERALASRRLQLILYRPFGATEMQFRCKVYQPDQAIVLSHVLPVLEHLGLRVVDEVPHVVPVRAPAPDGTPDRAADPIQQTVIIHDFGLETQSGAGIALGQVTPRFREAFLAVWTREAESDRLNALVLSADLDIHQVGILRAYTRYLRQLTIPFTQAYLERVLTAYPSITGLIVRLFLARFDPECPDDAEDRAAKLRGAITSGLDDIASAEDDRLLRRYLNLVDSTLRTNWFQTDADGRRKPYLSLKLDSRRIDELPLPRPMVEVFVYGPAVEGIHLRGGKVARGGIRWSDRREDFRTEVLGLMKAQTVKNAVIVPVGAKGGFVMKQPPNPADREAWQAEGVACYRMFIRALLDVTDNLAGGDVVPPPDVVRRDGDDPYLVVAADKGTATFSDIANGIAQDHGFWLGDAFASGGSQGYDHKAMGITARGAWESVKRHFRELGRDIQRQDFTVIGVGDMSGDVFGNGMLLSEHIRLLAAFDHRHIFVDPDPDAGSSLEERRRLFALPRSSWQDYDGARLSAGGAVFDRRAKMLTLSPSIRARFGITAERLTPAELMRTLLQAEVDLLWFGGIGTFVKSSDETHADAGDRSNDAVRLDGAALRCKVIGEGANLAVTQAGRIEYARAGGRINTDFIDNSAGVDCSDHEVNIKILLDAIVADGDLTTKQRNQLLAEMTDEVADLVLRDNYLQTQALTLIEAEGFARLEAQARLIRMLERQGRLDRKVDGLPDDEMLVERAAARQGLVRPEIAVVFARCKLWLHDEILGSDLPDDRHLATDVVRYFPSALRERFAPQIGRHRLKRELIATTIVNSLINRMGGTFVPDIAERTGMRPSDISRAYIIARDVHGVRSLWDEIEALDGTVPASTQVDLHREVQRLIERSTLWFLRNGGSPLDIGACVEAFEAPVRGFRAVAGALLPEKLQQEVRARAAPWVADGAGEDLAGRIALLAVMPSACDIVRIARDCERSAEEAAQLYFAIGERLGFGWLRERADRLGATGYWQRLAVSAIVEELSAHQRDLTRRILAEAGGDGEGALDAWAQSRQSAVDRNRALLTELEAAPEVDLSMLAVASRHLRSLTEG